MATATTTTVNTRYSRSVFGMIMTSIGHTHTHSRLYVSVASGRTCYCRVKHPTASSTTTAYSITV